MISPDGTVFGWIFVLSMLPRHRITEPSWCWLLSTIWIINISNCTGNSYFITGCCKCFSRDSSSLCKRHKFLHVPMGCTMPEVPDFSSFCFPHLGLYCHIFSCDVLDPISIGLEIWVAVFFLVPCRWHTCKLQHSFVFSCKWKSFCSIPYCFGAIFRIFLF